MAFPKTPSKPISGRLKLMVRPPTQVQVDAEPAPAVVSIAPGADDGEIKFRLPPGFGLDTDLLAVISRQQTAANSSVDEIDKRYSKCAPCRSKGYKKEMSDSVRHCIGMACTVLLSKAIVSPNLIVSHEKSGDISFEVKYQNRTVITFAKVSSDVLIGLFENGREVSSSLLSDEQYNRAMLWLVGGSDGF